MNDYIVLTDSRGAETGVSKRFKAVELMELVERTDGWSQALDGSLDKSAGSLLRSWQYQLTVPYSVTDSAYGTFADLKTLFSFNDPNGTPTDVITLTDHFGATFSVYFFGKLDPRNLTTILDGVNSRWIVAIALKEKV